jgi:hypothetical protein
MPAKFPLVSRKRFEKVRKDYRNVLGENERLAADHRTLLSRHETLAAEHAKAASERDRLREWVFGSGSDVDQALLPGLLAVFRQIRLAPIATCRNQRDWDLFISGSISEQLRGEDEAILRAHQFEEAWTMAGYSAPAGQFVHFAVDNLWGGRRDGDRFIPNIRERLVCPITGLNNRQRVIASLIAFELQGQGEGRSVYFMEQVTAIYQWALQNHGAHSIAGSEFLGPDLEPGEIVDGLRHEDAHNLSFETASLDLVISNDVMEHLPWPRRAFGELARVLRPGGAALMTFPFYVGRAQSAPRAELIDGQVVHHIEPEYHGNPVSTEGSLVYTDYGWDLLDLIRDVGFRDAALEVYHSAALGHLGLGNLVFRLRR